jgi:hypothetical protein
MAVTIPACALEAQVYCCQFGYSEKRLAIGKEALALAKRIDAVTVSLPQWYTPPAEGPFSTR